MTDFSFYLIIYLIIYILGIPITNIFLLEHDAWHWRDPLNRATVAFLWPIALPIAIATVVLFSLPEKLYRYLKHSLKLGMKK